MIQDDSLAGVYAEMVAVETEMLAVGRGIKEKSHAVANTTSNYELAKSKEILEMFKQEAETGTKRTEAQRTAIYREKFSNLRLAKMIAQADMDSDRELLKALSKKADLLQSRKNILALEYQNYTGRT